MLWLEAWVARVEAACSRFSPTSDLSRANDAAGSAVAVSPELLAAYEAAAGMALRTNGLYDPTVGTAVIDAGYDRTFEAIVAEGPGRRGPGQRGGAWRQVDVDLRASTIAVPQGYRLDLGGSAKGWAVDSALMTLCGSLLVDYPDAGVCISAGGDIAVAGISPAGGWPVTISERLDRSTRGRRGPGSAPARRDRHQRRHGPPVDRRRGNGPPHHRSAHGSPRVQRLVAGHDLQRHLPGGRHRRHRCLAARRRCSGMAGLARAWRAPGRRAGRRHHRRRSKPLAGTRIGMIIALTQAPSPLWFFARASGFVS